MEKKEKDDKINLSYSKNECQILINMLDLSLKHKGANVGNSCMFFINDINIKLNEQITGNNGKGS